MRVAPEVAVGCPLDTHHLESHGRVEHADVPGVHPQRLARGQLIADQLAGQFDPGPALAADALQQEALAREDACAEGLLEAGADWMPGVPARNPCRCTMNSRPGVTLTGRMLPGSFAANAMVPVVPFAE